MRDRRLASPGRRWSRAPGTRPSRFGDSASTGAGARGRQACGTGTTAAPCPRCRGPPRAAARRCAGSGRRTRTAPCRCGRTCPSSPALATSRATFSYATSSSKASPRCVSFSATLAFSFSATSRSRICSYSSVTAAAPAASGIASPSRSCSRGARGVQLAQDGDAFVERLAGDEAGGADAPSVLLHESLEPAARPPRAGSPPGGGTRVLSRRRPSAVEPSAP